MAIVFFIIALLALYFRNRIIRQIINSQFLMAPPVYAQVIPQRVTKKIQYLPDLELEGGRIEAYRSMQGLALKTTKYNLPKSCKLIQRLSHKFMILYSNELSNDDKEQISKCYKHKGYSIVDLDGVKFTLRSDEYKIFEHTQAALKDKWNLINLLLTKKYRAKVNENKSIATTEKQRLYKLEKLLSGQTSNLAYLMRAHIYLDLGFKGKVDKLIRQMISQEFIKNFFETEPLGRQKEVEASILEILVNLKEKFDDQKLVQTLVTYLSYKVSLEFRDMLLEEFDVPSKLSFVQEHIDSYNYALVFPFVWGNWIEKYSSTVELEKYLEKTDLFKRLEQNDLYSFGMLRSYFPRDNKKREILLSAYQKLQTQKSGQLIDLKFRLDENEKFKQFLMQKELDLMPIFKEKRKFYKNEILSNRLINYSLYQLLKLGDFKAEYFIKALAIRAYGL